MLADLASGGTTALGAGEYPTWSADSRYLSFVTGGKANVFDRQTRETRTVGNVASFSEYNGDVGWRSYAFAPRWSTDGSMLLTSVSNGTKSLYTIGADGRRLQRLATKHAAATGPAWWPDARRIAAATRSAILVVDARTGRSHVFTRVHNVARSPVNVAWAPDGSAIAYDVAEEGAPVRVMPLRPKARALTISMKTEDARPARLSWSSSGSKLAFEYDQIAYRSGLAHDPRIRIVSRRGSRVGDVETSGWGFTWSPDGRYFFHGGFSSTIDTTAGDQITVLKQLRAEQPAWRPVPGSLR